MVKNFKFEVPSFDYSSAAQNTTEFKNHYGTWNVCIFSFNYVLSGFMAFKPAFEIQPALFKQIKVKFTFQNVSCRRSAYNHEKVGIIDEKMMFFLFTPFQMNSSTTGYYYYQIDVKIEAPEISNLSSIESGSSKGHLLELFNTKKLADITIKTKDNEFEVHKFILVRSEVFDKMLNTISKESETGIIKIIDIKYEVLYEMCRYLYTDEIPKIEELALELLTAANKYKISGLASRCEQYLINNITNENVYDLLVVGDKLNIMDLKDTAIKYIRRDSPAIFSTEGWKNFKKTYNSIAMEVSKYRRN